MAFFSFCVCGCVRDLIQSTFATDVMYSQVMPHPLIDHSIMQSCIQAYKGLLGWVLHVLVFKVLAYMMSMSSTLSFIESACYTGYMFVLLTFKLITAAIPGDSTLRHLSYIQECLQCTTLRSLPGSTAAPAWAHFSSEV